MAHVSGVAFNTSSFVGAIMTVGIVAVAGFRGQRLAVIGGFVVPAFLPLLALPSLPAHAADERTAEDPA